MKKKVPQYLHYMYSYPHKTAYRTFSPAIDMANHIENIGEREASLYFHIPFCRYKCGFCNLFSQQSCNTSRIDAYLDSMERHVMQVSELTNNLQFSAFVIGGGTPLVLTAEQLDRLFNFSLSFGISPGDISTSIETSPDYADAGKLSLLKERGVSRLSIGVQSFLTAELQQIRRRIAVDTVEAALETISRIGFRRFNIDLIYGIEGQTVDSFLYSIRKALTYRPTELFLYPLYVRNGVGISTKARNESLYEMYKAGRDLLIGHGFRQTSMRRFVSNANVDPDYSCGDETVISCGCGGRSYIGDLHFATPYAVGQQNIKSIIDNYNQTVDFMHVTNGFLLSQEEKRLRYIIKNLMYYRGIERKHYKLRFGHEIPESIFQTLIESGFVEDRDGFIRLTEEGLGFSDDIGQLFISPEVKQRMDSYRLE